MWWTALILFLICLGLLIYLDTRKPENYPPGPTWWPVVGSALVVFQLRKRFGGYLYKASAHLNEKYGPVVGLRVGKDRQIVAFGYEAIKELFTKEEFDGRPLGPFYETRTWGTRKGLLLTDGEFWQEQRRFVLRHLREFGLGRRTMAHWVEAEAEQLVAVFRKKLGDSPSKILDMSEAFAVHVLNTLWMMMASTRYSPEDIEMKKMQNLLTELFASVDMTGALFSQFPFLIYLAPNMSGYKHFLGLHQRVWVFLKAELDRHKETFQNDDPRDLMDAYLQVLNSEDVKPSFSELQLLAICMDMFMAGSETTSKSLGWAFLYMLLYPEVQEKAREEIDRVVGRERLPTLNDRPNMPYCESIVYEAVRVFMGRAFSVPHRALKDTTLQGYHIPKDAMLVAGLNSVLMSEEYWGDPEVFRPDRFINKHGKVVVPDYYLPFGYGKHKCLGITLARSNVFLFTAALLQNFEFSIPPGEAPPDISGIDGVTPSPGYYRALVKCR